MPRIEVTSLDEPALAVYRDLKRSNLTRWSGRFIGEGDKVVLRLLASDFAVESVLAAESFEGLVLPLLEARPSTQLLVAPDRMIPDIVGFNFHRGLLACGLRRENPTLDELCLPRKRPLLLVICPDVQGPDNLGQIIRTSCALGIDAVLLGPHAGDPFSRRVLRVSMGAAFNIPIYASRDLSVDLCSLHDEFAVDLAATVLSGSAEPLESAIRPSRFALLFGSEGHGLDGQLVELCHRRLTIPMRRGTDSLNVAVAAGIFLHHFTARQTCNRG